ncbi:MAG: right-handed parallel beta-helix repeat-containing protein [Candidatus Woesearchaeota archaeon]
MINLQLIKIYQRIAEQFVHTSGKEYTAAAEEPEIIPAKQPVLDLIEIKGAEYTIDKIIEINSDFVFPAGNYHIKQDCGIRAKNCSITILPGTNFYFDDYAHIYIIGGKLLAAGKPEEKISFIQKEDRFNGLILLKDLESRLECCDTTGFEAMRQEKGRIVSYFSLINSNSQVNQCNFRNNKTGRQGFSILGGRAEFESCTFEENYGMDLCLGGGLYIETANVIFRNTKIRDNHVKHGDGGGVCARKKSKLIFENCEISYNTADCGGGISLAETNNSATFKSTIIKNNLGGLGGGLMVMYGSTAELDDACIIEGNKREQVYDGRETRTHETGEAKCDPKIIKESKEPGPDNLGAVMKRIPAEYGEVSESQIRLVVRDLKEKYKLNEMTANAIAFELKNRPYKKSEHFSGNYFDG